jgi:hypothetical protein
MDTICLCVAVTAVTVIMYTYCTPYYYDTVLRPYGVESTTLVYCYSLIEEQPKLQLL